MAKLRSGRDTALSKGLEYTLGGEGKERAEDPVTGDEEAKELRPQGAGKVIMLTYQELLQDQEWVTNDSFLSERRAQVNV